MTHSDGILLGVFEIATLCGFSLIAKLLRYFLLVAAIAVAAWFLYTGRSVSKMLCCWFAPGAPGARERALKRVLRERAPKRVLRNLALKRVLTAFGYDQSFWVLYGVYLFCGVITGLIIAVIVIAVLMGWRIPDVALKNVLGGVIAASVAGLIGAATLFIGLRQWWQARSEIALDKFYERLAATNDKRVDWWSKPRQDASLNVDDYRTRMYIHLELDNLEYSIQKYQIGWMSRENAYTTLRTFCQRCLERTFRDAAQGLVKSNIGYHPLTRKVVNEVHNWAKNGPSNWYQCKELTECMHIIDPEWDAMLQEAISAANRAYR